MNTPRCPMCGEDRHITQSREGFRCGTCAHKQKSPATDTPSGHDPKAAVTGE